MSKRQTMFTQTGIVATEDLTRDDLVLKATLEKVQVLCPRCLYFGNLWEFSKILKHAKRGHRISTARVMCPDCTEGFHKQTILKVADMDMEEFADYFWGGCFQKFGTGDKIRWNIFMKRLKQHYSREDKNIFWEVYHDYKAEREPEAKSDDEAYAEYQKTYQTPNQRPESPEINDDIVAVLKILARMKKRPASTQSIQYALTLLVPPRRVTRALETMESEGTIQSSERGWIFRDKEPKKDE